MALKHSPLWLALALVFWGWRGDTAWAAAGLLVLAAPAWFGPWRWPLTASQCYRLGDLTSLLFLGAIGYFAVAGRDTPPVYALLRWLPLVFSPLWLAQIYSGAEQLPLGALFYSMRRRRGNDLPPGIDFREPYLLLCLLAAGSGKSDDGAYFVGVALLLAAFLWWRRPGRRVAWLLGFALAVSLGYGGQRGLGHLQGVIEEWVVSWLGGGDGEADPYHARTSIGDLGRLKLSSRIVMRVRSDQPLTPSLLLKEAVYDRYLGQSWAAGRAAFAAFQAPSADGPRHVDVLRVEVPHGVLVTVPAGLRGLSLPTVAAGLTRNRLGTIQWPDAPPVLRYGIAYDPDAGETTAPDPEDLEVPRHVAILLRPLVEQLALVGRPPAEVVAVVSEFFARNFTYSLYLGDGRDHALALREFLYQRQSGHCEYFATATALLLRAGGVPARFVAGYSVDEYSPEERVYLVRSRHAHAWVEAYVAGAWRVVDTTPGIWGEQEAETDPWWRVAADVWSRWLTGFQVWRWEQAQTPEDDGFPLWGWLVLPLGAWLGWRLYRGRQRVAPRSADTRLGLAVDPAYRRFEEDLLRAGHSPRGVGEPPLAWLRRIERMDLAPEVIAYYQRRYRRMR